MPVAVTARSSKEFEVITCPKCNEDDVYFQEVGSKIVFRCYKCHVVFREKRQE